MYSFHNSCYSDLTALYKAMAQSCPVYDNGQSIKCTPNSDGYVLAKNDGLNTFSYQVNPSPIDCIIDYSQLAEVNGLLILLLITAFGFAAIKRVIR